MRIFYITGASRGIGKALAQRALQYEDAFVYGISRSHSITHERYTPIEMDLGDLEALKGWYPEDHERAEELVLINNAGTLGNIKPVGRDTDEAIQKSFELNLIAPAILSNKFLKQFRELKAKKLIVNVSSGAAQNAIDGWSSYCASKAGLDMFGDVMEEEERVHQHSYPFRILSIAPGVVETRMQEEIRRSAPTDFSNVQHFQDLKMNQELADPDDVAEGYFRIIEEPQRFTGHVSVRDLEGPRQPS
ncbi:MAG: SDR family NAD(P)-dependent oxidoreductase [Flavobacteriales bacterium]